MSIADKKNHVGKRNSEIATLKLYTKGPGGNHDELLTKDAGAQPSVEEHETSRGQEIHEEQNGFIYN